MKIKLIGNSGLRASEVCLGTMTFGEEGWGANLSESRKIFDAYVEAGGNFIDTANSYANGTSEKFVGEFIQGQREKFVIGTKYSLNTQSADPNLSGNHHKNMVQSVEGSLRRLKVDYIDLLWLHIWDHTTPVEEVMRSFDDLVRTGKVLYIGISDAPAWIVSSANTLAQLRGWTPFIALQIEYSLKERTPERDLIPMAKAFNLAITTWSPLGNGLLTGKYNESSQKDHDEKRLSTWSTLPNERELKIAKTVVDIAKKIGRSPSQVALNWIVQKGYQMFPIVGARKTSHLQENLGYASFSLSEEDLNELDKASQVSLGFPDDFFRSEVVQNLAFGGALKKISLPE
jgi:aryl-alcohol dehydrogenase-like predicted oxidoreductase